MAEIETVGIIGAGTMGAGIAITTAMAGLPTLLIDRSGQALDAARARLDVYLGRQVEKGRMTADEARVASATLRTGASFSDVAAADLVIEAVFERLDVKTALMAELEPVVSRHCLIATNTSCLRVSQIAQALTHPDRFLGLHYFSPAEINPLVELVRGDQTAPEAIEAAKEFLSATGRIALQCRDSNGFVVNRFFCPYVNEALRCLEDGLGSPAQIDRIACGLFGQPLGPFASMNIVGAPVMLHALENLAHLGALYEPAAKLRELAAANDKWASRRNTVVPGRTQGRYHCAPAAHRGRPTHP
ncbi:3-hydroxyacyl-CoA dehydrogenase family protein [Paenirhodobacter sp.]|uniref:3-hydroxyacyl-CoA dehydrogenase family protein n=1 Tax=Paenirhodobacter sp. TaxID=1965326 RepID=UPI003B3CD2B0